MDVAEYLEKGLALSHEKQYEEAIKCFDGIIKLDPTFPTAYSLKGYTCISAKKFDDAVYSTQALLKLDSEHILEYAILGVALRMQGKYEETLQNINTGMNCPLFKQDRDCQHRLYQDKADVLVVMAKYEAAIKYYDMAIDRSPNNVETYCHKGLTLEGLGLSDEALTYYDVALKLDKTSIKAYRNKISLLEGLERYPKALACHQMAQKFVKDW